jgi:ATP-dependent phosphoenolpyruvate carboxykinase
MFVSLMASALLVFTSDSCIGFDESVRLDLSIELDLLVKLEFLVRLDLRPGRLDLPVKLDLLVVSVDSLKPSLLKTDLRNGRFLCLG